MDPKKEIKMDNTAINAVFVLSFASEKEFVSANETVFYTHYEDLKIRRGILRDVYRAVKALEKAESKDI